MTRVDLIPFPALEHAADCLRTIAHPVRLRVLELLLSADHTVGELAEACEIPSPAMSEHLRLLKDRGLLRAERDGRRVYYRIDDHGLEGIVSCIRKRFGNLHPTTSSMENKK